MKNIIPVLISFIILFSGSFSFALIHHSCVVDGNIHKSCDMDNENMNENSCCKKESNCNLPGLHEEIHSDMDCCEIHTEKYEHSEPCLPFVKDSKVKQFSLYYSIYITILKYSDQSEINSYPNSISFSVRDVCTLNSSFRI